MEVANKQKKTQGRFRSNEQRAAIKKNCLNMYQLQQMDAARSTFASEITSATKGCANVFMPCSADDSGCVMRSLGDDVPIFRSMGATDSAIKDQRNFAVALEKCKEEPANETQRASMWTTVKSFTDQVDVLRDLMKDATLNAMDDEFKEGMEQTSHWVGYDLAVGAQKFVYKMEAEMDEQKLQMQAFNDTTCPICHDEFEGEDTVTVTLCKHAFCTDCLETWKGCGGHKCPLCNASLGNNVTANENNYQGVRQSLSNEPHFLSLVADNGDPVYTSLGAQEDLHGFYHDDEPRYNSLVADNQHFLSPEADNEDAVHREVALEDLHGFYYDDEPRYNSLSASYDPMDHEVLVYR